MKKILIIFMILLPLSVTFAEDDFFSDDTSFDEMDMEDLFGEDDDFIEEVEDTSDTVAEASELLTTDGVEWGGSFSSSISAGVSYTDFPGVSDLFDHNVYNEDFTPKLSATLYFNSRPKSNVRFHGKFKTSLPFYDSATVDVYANDGSKIPTEVKIPKIKIYELYSDFDYKSKVYFRVGKQNARWGVGYFFSPADFLSMENIDLSDPEADREGPIAIKMSMPFGLNNVYMFVSVPEDVFTKEDASISDLIVAPQAQFLLGDTEISTGLFYQKNLAPKAMVAATYSTNNNIGKFSFFGEAVGMYGSDRNYLQDDLTTFKKIDDEYFFKGTVGFRWSRDIKENKFSLAAQYLYNGDGYEKDDKALTLLNNPVYAVSKVLSGDLGSYDILYKNRHYLGLNFAIDELFKNEKLSLNLLTLMNLADISGYVNPAIRYEFFDYVTGEIGASFNLSDDGDEYYNDRLGFHIKFEFGVGDF